jgi:hypothetical protein
MKKDDSLTFQEKERAGAKLQRQEVGELCSNDKLAW